MPRFRNQTQSLVPGESPSSPLEQVRRLAHTLLQPAHFFVEKSLTLKLEHVAREEIYWEIFRGRLLDRPHTSRRQAFEAWNLFLLTGDGRSAEPLLSLKLDAAEGQLHVTRALDSYVWEAYDQGDNVILSRETRKWVRELVGSISLARFPSPDDLRDELICRVFQAVVGTSRLPLTSVEAPLPQFSLGLLAYFYRSALGPFEAEAGPLRSYRDLMEKALADDLAWIEKAKLLETLLHATPWQGIHEAADELLARFTNRQELLTLFRTLFNEVSLSPYTDLVDKTLAFWRALQERNQVTAEDAIDFLSYLLRQQGRHLTAYDLVTFHHRGANYPDALLLDAVLKAYLEWADRRPDLFLPATGSPLTLPESPTDGHSGRVRGAEAKRIRRRALRQGWLLRRRYEGHLVPEAPTSQGESARVLPQPHVRVPEEQILYAHKRPKRLFAGDSLDPFLSDPVRAILRESIHDLRHPQELRELGMALFLDRPFDAGKAPPEPDQTLLISYLAFSRSIARQRLHSLAGDLALIPDRAEYDMYREALDNLPIPGIPGDAVAGKSRPGGVSLADARKAAEDFLFVRTTAQSARDFFTLYSVGPLRKRFALNDLSETAPVLIVRTEPAGLAIYDAQLRKRVEFDFDPRLGYASRGGIEYPLNPLRVLRVWENTNGELREHDLTAEPILLPPGEK